MDKRIIIICLVIVVLFEFYSLVGGGGGSSSNNSHESSRGEEVTTTLTVKRQHKQVDLSQRQQQQQPSEQSSDETAAPAENVIIEPHNLPPPGPEPAKPTQSLESKERATLDELKLKYRWKQHPSVPLALSRDGRWTPTTCLEQDSTGYCLFFSGGTFDPPLDARRIRQEAKELVAARRRFQAEKEKRKSSPSVGVKSSGATKQHKSDFECSFEQLQHVSAGNRISFAHTRPQTVKHKEGCQIVPGTRHDLLVSWTAASLRINQRAADEGGKDSASDAPLQPYPKLLFRGDSLHRNKASRFVSIMRDQPWSVDRGHHGLHLYIVTTHRDMWLFRDSAPEVARAWKVPPKRIWRVGSATCDFPTLEQLNVQLDLRRNEEILLAVQYCSHLGVERAITVPAPWSQWTAVIAGSCCWDVGFHRIERYADFALSALRLVDGMAPSSMLFLDGWSSGREHDKSPLRGNRIEAKKRAYQAFANLVARRGRATAIFFDAGALAEKAAGAMILPMDEAGHFSCIIRPHWGDHSGGAKVGQEKPPEVKGLKQLGQVQETCADPFNLAIVRLQASYARAPLPAEKPMQLQAFSSFSSAVNSAVVSSDTEAMNYASLSAADIYYAWRFASSLSNTHFILRLGETHSQFVSSAVATEFHKTAAENTTFTCELHPELSSMHRAAYLQGVVKERTPTQEQKCRRLTDAFEKDADLLLQLCESPSAAIATANAPCPISRDEVMKNVAAHVMSKCTTSNAVDRLGMHVEYAVACQRLSEVFMGVPIKDIEGRLGFSAEDLRRRLGSWQIRGKLTKMEL